MTAPSADWWEGPAWSPRRARWFLIAAHLPFMLTSPIYAITGLDGPPARHPAVPLLAGLAIGALQLRHSFAAVRRERPRGWRWTFLLLIVLVYLPMPWFTGNWIDMQLFVVVSAIMLLRRPLAVAVAVLSPLGTLVGLALTAPAEYTDVGVVAVAAWAVFWLSAGFTIGVVATYGSVWLVRIVDELRATRTELAEVAIGRERLRVSRDLHDLLGQSLSAVSLKGDLALRLLSKDTPAARAQIENLTLVARDALAGMRAVTRNEHSVSLEEETRGVTALLGAAGIDVRLDVRLPGLAPAVQDVLAWAVREGVTNVLRHSDARICTITASRRGGTVRLEIVNDGVREPKGGGSGLAGLAERARALSGSVSADGAKGRFRMLVEIPEEPA
ncbi:sensor histidine kinase [Spirillospora sp. CA-142024]|uniref:sensor histidine kinase n=1 Tax=Spirillospora sp. CA-142024 TaxID=3240036 RepID=UPI003D8AD1E6